MIKEVLVVEGKMDVVAIDKAVEATASSRKDSI